MSAWKKVWASIAGSLMASMFLIAPATAQAATTIAVHPGESIQAAVDSAHPGDTVVVMAGTYRESVVIRTNGLTLRGHGMVWLTPSADGAGMCNQPGEEMGICVIPADIDFNTGAYTHRVRDVSIEHLHVKGFSGFGIFGYGTANLRVAHVHAVDNAVYGIARFDGVRGSITHSAASGSGEAGIYVGDSPNAHAVVKHNRAWNNGFGIFVRHTHFVTVRDNRSWGNCIGVFLLDDGQPEGSGNNRVMNNWVTHNNRLCPADPSEGVPPLSGGGVVLLGSQHNHVVGNYVTGNRRPGSPASGGIVLLTSPFSMKGANGNVVRGNTAMNNLPADIVKDRRSVHNRFIDNHCATSRPSWICAA